MKKVKLAYRFGDINDADKFIDDNKIGYDEIMVLFDTLIEEQPQQQATPKRNISKSIQQEPKDDAESEEYQEADQERPL